MCEYAFMRTTIDLPDALGKRMKIRAAQEGQSLKTLIARALERELSAPTPVRPAPHAVPLPVIKSRRPGSLKMTPAEISELLVREEISTYAADVRH